MKTVTIQEALAIKQRSQMIAKELSEEGIHGWLTALTIIGWLLSTQSKEVADDLTKNLTNEIRDFPGYPK